MLPVADMILSQPRERRRIYTVHSLLSPRAVKPAQDAEFFEVLGQAQPWAN